MFLDTVLNSLDGFLQSSHFIFHGKILGRVPVDSRPAQPSENESVRRAGSFKVGKMEKFLVEE